jgi:hypothetical protein
MIIEDTYGCHRQQWESLVGRRRSLDWSDSCYHVTHGLRTDHHLCHARQLARDTVLLQRHPLAPRPRQRPLGFANPGTGQIRVREHHRETESIRRSAESEQYDGWAGEGKVDGQCEGYGGGCETRAGGGENWSRHGFGWGREAEIEVVCLRVRLMSIP